jgi:Mn-dependent DtxR family transcriptional regulator
LKDVGIVLKVSRMNDPEKMTIEGFQMLKTIDELCANNSFSVAPIREVINVVTAQRNVKSGAVRKMVWELAKEGYIENPLRGCWRLSEKGRSFLRGMKKE